MSFGTTDRTAFFCSRWPVRDIFMDTCRIRGLLGADRTQVPLGVASLCSQAACCSRSRHILLPISRALAVCTPKNIHRVSVALVRALIRLRP